MEVIQLEALGFQTIGNRRLISNNEPLPQNGNVMILDTNVIKDISSFYYGNKRKHDNDLYILTKYIRRQMKSTQHSFGPCGLCYELGLSELCLSQDDSVNYKPVSTLWLGNLQSTHSSE